MKNFTTENTEGTEGGWRSVEVEMPDSDTDVIVATEDRHVDAGFHDGRLWRWATAQQIEVGVTHWMPFPEPPEVAR